MPPAEPPQPVSATHVAIANFAADDLSWQRSVSSGDELVLVSDHGDGWSEVMGVCDGQKGSIPSAYMQATAGASGAGAGADEGAVGAPGGAVGGAVGTNVGTHVVLADFSATEGWQMSVRKDEVVALIADHGDGWADVRSGDKTGTIPSGYITLR